MYPLARFSSMYTFSDSSSLGVRGYILQLIFCGASGLSLMGSPPLFLGENVGPLHQRIPSDVVGIPLGSVFLLLGQR